MSAASAGTTWTGSGTGPGFVDLQVNGALGVDFAAIDLSEPGARRVAHHVLGGGVAAFLPTIISSPLEVYRRNLGILARLVRDPALEGRVAGLHLEGPFLAQDERVLGVHRRQNVCVADLRLLEDLQTWADGTVRLITIAAEIEGAAELTAAARRLGMAVSIGHSWADEDSLARARDAGAVALTHFGNGIPLTLPRHDNPVMAGLATEGLMPMLILDGHHLTRGFARAVVRTCGADGVVLVSDASPAAGLESGCYRLFGQDIEVAADGKVWNPIDRHLAGSSASLIDCVNQALTWGLFDAQAAIRAAFEAPIELAGLDARNWSNRPRVAFDQGRFKRIA